VKLFDLVNSAKVVSFTATGLNIRGKQGFINR